MSASVKERIVQELDTLTDPQLEELLRTVDALRKVPKPLSGAELVRLYAGMLSDEEADATNNAPPIPEVSNTSSFLVNLMLVLGVLLAIGVLVYLAVWS